MRTLSLLGLFLALSASAATAASFADVPRTHWAYAAIQRAADAGILQGYDGKFMGDRTLNRYQVAVVIQRILDGVAAKGGPAAAGVNQTFVRELESLLTEFADELAASGVRVSSLEESLVGLRQEVDGLKFGDGPSSRVSGNLADAFTGFVAVALVATDDGTGTSGLGTRTRWTGTTADQTFFTIPQASMALDTAVRPGVVLHVQYDYSTDVPSALPGGAGVGLNEAYIMVDELFGEIGAKIGGFALPMQSWEVNGPFRTSTMTITPSAANTAFEAFRGIGMELSPVREIESAGFQWRLGVTNGGDVAAVPGGFTQFATMSDAVGLGALTGSVTNDAAWGIYLDLESLDDSDRTWGWRVSFFDLGGDVAAAAPAATTLERNGWQVGFWWQGEKFRAQTQYVRVESVTGAGTANETDSYAWYLLLNYQMNDTSSITLRYDNFENEVDALAAGNDGDAITLAYNRELSKNSVFQFEWLTLDHDNSPGVIGQSEIDDDLIQLRYKVWF